jgi:hypothetical protein
MTEWEAQPDVRANPHRRGSTRSPNSRSGGSRPRLIKIPANHPNDRSEMSLIQGI